MPPQPSEMTAELPRDPRIHVLTLPNGLVTWLWRRPDPAGGITVALSVAAGSLCEAPEERGLAHLLEHLAFRGGGNLSADDLARLFERTGTRLGRHHNAATGLDRTTFSLSFPGRDDATVALAVACLADFARGLTLAEDAVASERRIVLEEARARRSAGRQLRERLLELLLPGSDLGRLHPLGDPEVVAEATSGRLRRFYQRWYRPDSCTVAVAGDVEVAGLAAAVDRFLGDWTDTARSPLVPGLDLGEPTRGATAVIRERRAPPEARLLSPRQVRGARSLGDLRRQLAQDGALWLLGRRLNERVAEGSTVLRSTRLVRSTLAGSWTLLEAIAEAPADDLEAAVAELGAEVARIERHGFGPDELELLGRSLRLGAQRAERRDDGRGAATCMVELLEAIHAGVAPPPSPAQRLELVEGLCRRLTTDEVTAALARQLPADALAVVIAPQEHDPAPDPVRAQARRADAAAAAAPLPARPRRDRLLDAPLPAGGILGRACEPAIDVTSLELQSGLVVHLKPMPSSPERAVIQATWAGGRIEETAATLGLTAAAALALASPATRRIPSAGVRDALAGSSVAVSCSVHEDCVSLVLTSDPEELGTALELLALLLGEPVVEGPALGRWRSAMRDGGEGVRRSLEDELALTALQLLTGGDPRFATLAPARAAAIELDGAQRWLDEVLGCSPVEVAVVGPDGPAALEAEVVRCLAGLRPRPRTRPELEPLRLLPASETAATAEVEAPTEGDRAAVLAGWRATPYRDAETRALLHMAVQLLDRRLHRELREIRGLTYDPDCSFSPSRAYPAASLLSATFYTAPERVEEALEAARGVFETLASHGPTEAEMESVRTQFAELAAQAQRDPRFWARTLGESRYRETTLATLSDLVGRCRRRSADELRSALARCVRPERRLTVICRPSRG